MAHTKGIMIRTEENGWAEVVCERSGACSGCHSTQNCHSCLSHSKTIVRVLNKAGANEGDLVSINLSNKELLKGAATLYLLPVVGLMVGAFIGPNFDTILSISGTGLSVLFSFLGLCLGFSIAAFVSRRKSAKNKMVPIADKIIFPKHKPPSKIPFNSRCQTNTCPHA